MLGKAANFVAIQDEITDNGNIFIHPFQQILLLLIWGGEAHGSYWNNEFVAQKIGEVVR